MLVLVASAQFDRKPANISKGRGKKKRSICNPLISCVCFRNVLTHFKNRFLVHFITNLAILEHLNIVDMT
ncbi:hypothetical protein GCM10027050_23310 [Psychrosphaera aestuarii]